MGRRPAGDKARTIDFHVRLTDDEMAFLDARAKECGLSRSAFARLVLGGASLGEHVPGKVEETTPADQVVEARIPAATRRATRPITATQPSYHCPSCSGLTMGVGGGKRRCRVCGWEGKA